MATKDAGWPAPLLDLLIAVARSRWLVLAVWLIAGVGLTVWWAKSRPYYESAAVAVLMPRERPSFDVAVRSASLESGEDRAERAGSARMLLPPQPDLYIELLLSSPVLGRIVDALRDEIAECEGFETRAEAIPRLRRMIKLEGSDEGLLTVTATSRDADLAMHIVNRVVDEGIRVSKDIERDLLESEVKHLDDGVAEGATRCGGRASRLRAAWSRRRWSPRRRSGRSARPGCRGIG